MNIEKYIEDNDVKIKGKSFLTVNGIEKRTKIDFSMSQGMELAKKYPEIELQTSEPQKELFAKCLKHLQDIKNKKIEETRNSGTLQGTSLDLDNLYRISDLAEYDSVVYFDSEDRKIIQNYKSKHIIKHIERMVGDENVFNAWRSSHDLLACVVYNPNRTEFLYEEGRDVYINTYYPPNWQTIVDNEGVSTPPTEYSKLMSHLFEDEQSRDVAERWLFDAVFYRAHAHLLLHGVKGTGKSTFMELACALVGKNNYAKGTTERLESGFQYNLESSKLFTWEEINFSKQDNKNKIKNYINKEISSEKKFKDVAKSQQIFASHVMANNNIDDNYIELDDRIFCIPDLTEKRLDSIMEFDEIAKFKSKFEDDDFLSKVGFYLRNKYQTYPALPLKVYVSKTFKTLVMENMGQFKRFCINTVLGEDVGECHSLKSLKELYTKDTKLKATHYWKTIKKMFELYNDKIEPVFEIVDEKGKQWIKRIK